MTSVWRGVWRGVACAWLALCLSACGGGGGPLEEQVRATLDRTLATLQADKGTAATLDVTVTLTMSSTGTLPVYLRVRGGPELLADALLLSETSATRTIRLVSRSDLAAGTYSSTLSIDLCADAACAKTYGASPLTLPVTLNVLPVLEVAPQASISRRATDAPARVSLPLTVPAGAAVVTATVESGSLTPYLTATVVGDQLQLSATYAPPGTYAGTVRLQTGDGRYQATTQVSYVVSEPGTGEPRIVVAQPSVQLTVSSGASVSQDLVVTPPNWSPVLEIGDIQLPSGMPSAAFRLTATGSGVFRATVDASALPSGSYTVQVTYRSSAGLTAVQSIAIQVSTVLTVAPAVIDLSPTRGVDALRTTADVSLADGRALTWQVDTTALPAWLSLDSSTGVTGRDPIRFRVDPGQMPPGLSTVVQLPVSIEQAAAPTVNASLTVQDRLPRLTGVTPRAFYPADPSGTYGWPSQLYGYFPAGVFSRSQLEILGAGAGVGQQSEDLFRVTTFQTLAGSTVTFRLSYPAWTSTLSVPVRAVPSPLPTPLVFPLPMGVRKPAVYSQRDEAFFFIVNGAVNRLALRGGTWQLEALPADGAVDLDLTVREDRLLVMSARGIDAVDPGTLGRIGSVRSFASGELSPAVASSRLKHLGVTYNDRLFWISDGERCDARLWSVPLSAPQGSPTLTSLPCQGTSSQASLLVNRGRRFVTLYQADNAKAPVVLDVATGSRDALSSLPGLARGLEGSMLLGAEVVDALGNLSASTPFGFSTPVMVQAYMPVGITVAGFGLRDAGLPYVAYGYASTTVAGGRQEASGAKVLVFRSSSVQGPQDLRATVDLPQAVGCLQGRPADEPCEHLAQLTFDSSGQHLLVLGPRAAILVSPPLSAPAAASGRGSSIYQGSGAAGRR